MGPALLGRLWAAPGSADPWLAVFLVWRWLAVPHSMLTLSWMESGCGPSPSAALHGAAPEPSEPHWCGSQLGVSPAWSCSQ